MSLFVDFPDESQMERSQDGSEPIRGGSIGFNLILGRFFKQSQIDKQPEFPLYLINGLTVFRNNFHPDDTLREMVPKWEKDIHTFTRYLEAYLSYVYRDNPPTRPVSVVIFLPDYKRIPQGFLRVPTGNNLKQHQLYSEFLRKYSHPPECIRQTPLVNVWLVPAGGGTYPHIELIRWLDRYVRDVPIQYDSTQKYCLISHIPFDLNISFRRPKVSLLESYTAKLLLPKEFGLKIDKSGVIPFLPVTHVVFGDKVMIQPMVKPKMRSLLLDRAQKERWQVKSPAMITNSIISATNLPSTLLKTLNFA